jgi:hypothetical protein
MTIYTLSGYAHDDDGFSEVQNNYFGILIGAGYKVTKVQVKGSIALEAQTLSPPSDGGSFIDWLADGIQYGTLGYTPYDISPAADLDDSTWWDVSQTLPTPSEAVWAPDTDSAGLLDRYIVSRTVYPQYLVPSGGVEIYYSVGNSDTPSVGYKLFASCRVWYHG